MDPNQILENNIDKYLESFNEECKKAENIAHEVTGIILDKIIKNKKEYDISTAILTVSYVMSYLSSFLYETEEEFQKMDDELRHKVTEEIIPFLLNPQPCNECEACKKGEEEECLDPIMDMKFTVTGIITLLSSILIQHNLFNRIIGQKMEEELLNAKREESEQKENNQN